MLVPFSKWDKDEDYVIIPTILFTLPPKKLGLKGFGFCLMWLRAKVGILIITNAKRNNN